MIWFVMELLFFYFLVKYLVLELRVIRFWSTLYIAYISFLIYFLKFPYFNKTLKFFNDILMVIFKEFAIYMREEENFLFNLANIFIYFFSSSGLGYMRIFFKIMYQQEDRHYSFWFFFKKTLELLLCAYLIML